MELGAKALLIAAILNILIISLIYVISQRRIKKQLSGYRTISNALQTTRNLLANTEEKIEEENTRYQKSKQQAKELINKIRLLTDRLKTTQKNLENADKKIDIAKTKYNDIYQETNKLQSLLGRENELETSIESKMQNISSLKSEITQLDQYRDAQKALLHKLMTKIDLYTQIEEYVDHGSFEVPDYLYETSDRFSEEIKMVRECQRNMIKNKTVITYSKITTISDDQSINKIILDGQSKLMLTAFNIECDTLIGKVKPSTFTATIERIEKLANSLEKSAASLACGFNIEYVKLKFEECRLQYQFSLKKQEEIEEQRAIREQIREEQRAIKEYERAVEEAEKEEKMYRQLLEKAKQELQTITNEERATAEARIFALEQQLAEAEAKEARAKSMAEQTRKGHVYVISNIGSFGKDIYKIGLTRRLDPMDRVKELGDASVPFSFDVHAMIYVEDAPALENSLHREFSSERVNLVNQRKEFFQVSLNQVKEAVSRIAGLEAEFKTTIAAEEYFESQRLRGKKVELQETLH